MENIVFISLSVMKCPFFVLFVPGTFFYQRKFTATITLLALFEIVNNFVFRQGFSNKFKLLRALVDLKKPFLCKQKKSRLQVFQEKKVYTTLYCLLNAVGDGNKTNNYTVRTLLC